MTVAADSVRFEFACMTASKSICSKCIKIKSRISEGMVASVCLGPYIRFRGVPIELNDLIDLVDMEDSELRRFILEGSVEAMYDLSEASSGGINDLIGCLMIVA